MRSPRRAHADAAAKVAWDVLPDAPAPMLCTLVDVPFDGPDWIFEPKFDGLRVIARIDGGGVTLQSRNNKPQEARFPEVAEALRSALSKPAIVDGEVVCLDDQGRTSFRELQQRFHLDDPAEIRIRMERHPAYIYLFDIVQLGGSDLTRLPLSERRERLQKAIAWSDRVRLTDSVQGRGIETLQKACVDGLEGIVAKRLNSRYVPGRSDAWVKIKCVGRQEFVIAGWTDPQRSRVGLGALLVGYYEGDALRYAGKVGTGYTHEVLLDLRRRLEKLGRVTNPFDLGEPPMGPAVHWVRPELVAEIAFAEWTQNGLLRQPRYEGLRPDKAPRECRRERPAPASTVVAQGRRQNRNSARRRDTDMPLEPSKIELTHPDRVLFPDAGLTKKDVFDFYRKIARHLLPFLKDRPVTLERLPEGLAEGAPHFWQKDTPASYPEWIPRIELETEAGKPVHYTLVNDEATLLYLVNLASLTFHVWASRVGDLDRPDFVLFDLDPGKASFGDVVAVARVLKTSLDERDVPSFVKTSGKTGLHVLTPWNQEGGFDEARAWAREIAEHVADAMPKQATVEIRKAKRGGRVYIDVLQNARGHHAVPPYALRAIPQATVSTPLDWREVTEKLDPGSFTAKRVLARLARRKTDPMAELLASFRGRRGRRRVAAR